jgi:hypothetical protein
MFRLNKNIKTKCGQHTGKALSNHESFSLSQSHEIVPLKEERERGIFPDIHIPHMAFSLK